MTSPAPLLSGLGAWQEARGARRGDLAGGGETTLDYGDPAGELGALREGCGLVDLGWRDRLVVRGADRLRFLNAYLTCNLKEVATGQGTFGFFTSGLGRILADAVVAALDDRLLVLLPPARGAPIREHLSRFVVAERVELGTAEGILPLAIAGPRTAEILAEVGAPAPDSPWAVETWTHGEGTAVQACPQFGEVAYLLWVAGGQAAATAMRLVAGGARPVGSLALEALRIERGVPRFGLDYDEDHFPQETGLDEAVSYAKGCYLGQEVVARIHYRGHVNRKLSGLVFEADGAEALRTHEPLLLAGEEVGRLGSVVDSARLGRAIGLAVLRAKAAAPGTPLATESGATAAVVSLPFVE